MSEGVVRIKSRCPKSGTRRPLLVHLAMFWPAAARALARVTWGLPHGRVRRLALWRAACLADDCLNRRDWDIFDVAFHPDSESHLAQPEGTSIWMDLGSVWHGPDGVRRGMQALTDAWSELHFHLAEVIDAGERILFLHEMTATGAQSGVRITEHEAELMTVRDGWVIRWQQYWDWAEALEAVGLRE